MSKKDASQAKFEHFELFGISEQFDALFLRKNRINFCAKMERESRKVRSVLSEFYVKIRRRLQKRMRLKDMQHKGFNAIGAVKSWLIFAKSRAKFSRKFAQKCAKIRSIFAQKCAEKCGHPEP